MGAVVFAQYIWKWYFSALESFQHPLQNHRTGYLAIGCLRDDNTVLRLDDIIVNDEATAYGQAVHELCLVRP